MHITHPGGYYSLQLTLYGYVLLLRVWVSGQFSLKIKKGNMQFCLRSLRISKGYTCSFLIEAVLDWKGFLQLAHKISVGNGHFFDFG